MGEVIHAEQKFNGGTSANINALVEEYIGLHQVDPQQGTNKVTPRENAVAEGRKDLEGIVNKGIIHQNASKPEADTIIEQLVSKAYAVDGKHLPEGTKKQEEIFDYLRKAGVDYTQLITQIINTKKPVSYDTLPEGHPLKTLIRYISGQMNPEQRRILNIQQILASLGNVAPNAAAMAEAFNKYTKGETRFDSKFAKPEDMLQAYGQIVSGNVAKYDATDPAKVHNYAPAPAKRAA